MYSKTISYRPLGFIRRLWLECTNDMADLLRYEEQAALTQEILDSNHEHKVAVFNDLTSTLNFNVSQGKYKAELSQMTLDDIDAEVAKINKKYPRMTYEERLKIKDVRIPEFLLERGRAATRIINKNFRRVNQPQN